MFVKMRNVYVEDEQIVLRVKRASKISIKQLAEIIEGIKAASGLILDEPLEIEIEWI